MTAPRLATFATGSFWNLEDAFRRQRGVVHTAVGFSGGSTADPTYRDVASGKTGHVEAVRVQYDPDEVSYEQLLDRFRHCHDPSQKQRLPGQVGSQYRSVIFFHDAEQELAAKTWLERLRDSRRPLPIEIRAAVTFYLAEDYHQQYLEKRRMG